MLSNLFKRPATCLRPVACRSFSTAASWVEISKADLTDKLRENAVTLVDVREPHEIAETGRLQVGENGAINVPLGAVLNGALSMDPTDFEAEFSAKQPGKADPVVFSCRSGVRSTTASEQALTEGFTKVYNYKGSALEWFA